MANACDAHGCSSDSNTFQVIVDSAPEISLPGPDTTVSNPITVSGTAPANTEITIQDALNGYELVGSAISDGAGEWNTQISLTEGEHDLTAYACDEFNCTDNSDIVHITVSSGASIVTIDSVTDGNGATVTPGGTTTSPDITFAFSSTATDFDHFECSTDGSSFVTCFSPIQYTGLNDGLHTFSVEAVNTSAGAGPVPVALDCR